MADQWDLERFVLAQDAGGVYERAVSELRRARKSSHWMWFVFPQIARLGHSPMSMTYSISGLGEADAYLQHPVLGPRLLEASAIVAATTGASAAQIFGGIDAQKLRSSMTLFLRAAPEEPVFGQVLDAFFDGRRDPATEQLLRST